MTPSPAKIAVAAAEEPAWTSFEKASKERPWQNSLGMKFVPVAGTEVLFSIWDTRVQDFRAFAESSGYDATGGMWSVGKDGWKRRGATWKEPGFKQGSTHPVVGVSWADAKAFCEWLTKRERGSGVLPKDVHYRLPTDQEWSVAVGLDSEPGNTPEEKSLKIKLYPWGKEWPPLSGAGNYYGVESRIGNEPKNLPVIEGYNDRYPRTSPVGSFRQITVDCMIWEATFGSGARIGTIRSINSVCCVVHLGTWQPRSSARLSSRLLRSRSLLR